MLVFNSFPSYSEKMHNRTPESCVKQLVDLGENEGKDFATE